MVVETPPLSQQGRPAQGRKNNQGYIRATALTAARSYCMHGSDEVLIALSSRPLSMEFAISKACRLSKGSNL